MFVHISDFARRGDRPQVGDRLTYRSDVGERGKPRARDVRPAGAARTGPRVAGGAGAGAGRAGHAKTRIDPAPLFLIPAGAILYLLVTAFWPAPVWLPWLYGAASVVTFAVYAMDKAAARRGGRRTPENTLYLLSLAGGWPGALLGQVLLRHKSAKMPFRIVFWITVAGNVAGAVLLCSPPGRALLAG